MDGKQPQITRQKAFSDGTINLPRNLVHTAIGLSLQEDNSDDTDNTDTHIDPPFPQTSVNITNDTSTAPFYRIRSIPSSLEMMGIADDDTTSNKIEPHGWSVYIHTGALHFIFHLLLISLFETLFFWLFISQQEDQALTGLVNTYTGRAFSSCSNLTGQQRAEIRTWVSLFLNTSSALAMAETSAADRHTLNGILLRNSLLYFGGLTTTFGLLVSTALLRRLTLHWKRIVGENLLLVALLGLYEWMFFHTVALQYHAITPEELDGMIIREFEESC